MLAPGWGTGTRGGSPPGVKPVSVLGADGSQQDDAGVAGLGHQGQPDVRGGQEGAGAGVGLCLRQLQQ
jgi:hypothetical protein